MALLTVFVNPRKDIIDSYKKTLKDYRNFQDQLDAEVNYCKTTDNHEAHLYNVSKRMKST